jgi:DNA-binding transcriptional ArsR family regulator
MLAFWERNELAYSERLAQVVGTPRARILSALSTPMTQKDLTDALHLTNGPVGTQLAALTTAGLLDRARVGQRVFYRLSDRGEQLLVVFGDD